MGQIHRTATAAPSPQSRQTPRSPVPRRRTAKAAPAAQAAKQSSAAPSVRPSPNGSSAPYSIAQPPANPTATAASRRSAGRTAARGASADAMGRTAAAPSIPIRSIITKSPAFRRGGCIFEHRNSGAKAGCASSPCAAFRVLSPTPFAYTVTRARGVFWRGAGNCLSPPQRRKTSVRTQKSPLFLHIPQQKERAFRFLEKKRKAFPGIFGICPSNCKKRGPCFPQQPLSRGICPGFVSGFRSFRLSPA